ncbi:MAG: VaFE repeat-containing surface-anchored protein, partial [Actinobacteria bacterium]|nr:VaFE repeat-containing surface-anchored protein [Actinomycetota bacterium]
MPADPANPGTPDYWAYCIEHDTPAKTKTDGNVGDLSSYLGANHLTDPDIYGQIIWILAHGYPGVDFSTFGQAIGVPGIARNYAIEAAQYAIWMLTEYPAGQSVAWPWENNDSKTAYFYLLNGARASSGMSPSDFGNTVSVTPPTAPQTGGALVGPFTVVTDNAPAQVTVDPASALVDANGAPVNASAIADGQQLYLDLRGSTAAGSATVSASVPSSGGTGKILSVPNTPGGTATVADHAQSIVLVAADTHRTAAQAAVQWAAAAPVAVPAIGTTLVDAADGDHVLPTGGGRVIDTVAYRNLTPGVQVTLSGELMRKSDGQATGIVGSTTFTPNQADGTVDVEFTVPAGHAGESLVAFEYL